ncbi:MAG: hypothetical protein ACLR3C_00550 [Eggerthella lenta]
MKRKKTAYESREWKASGGAYGKADSVSPSLVLNIVLVVGILAFGAVKVAQKIMAMGVGATTMATIIIIIMTSPLNTIRLFGSTKPISASSATA